MSEKNTILKHTIYKKNF